MKLFREKCKCDKEESEVTWFRLQDGVAATKQRQFKSCYYGLPSACPRVPPSVPPTPRDRQRVAPLSMSRRTLDVPEKVERAVESREVWR